MQVFHGAAVGDKGSFEIKSHDYRRIALKGGSEITFYSRNKKLLNIRFPTIVEALVSLNGDFVLDGELVEQDSQYRASFQLQRALYKPMQFYLYDHHLLNPRRRVACKFALFRVPQRVGMPSYAGHRNHCAYHRCYRRKRSMFSTQRANSAWRYRNTQTRAFGHRGSGSPGDIPLALPCACCVCMVPAPNRRGPFRRSGGRRRLGYYPPWQTRPAVIDIEGTGIRGSLSWRYRSLAFASLFAI